VSFTYTVWPVRTVYGPSFVMSYPLPSSLLTIRVLTPVTLCRTYPSATAVILVAAGFVPDRTLEFHTYAAEEAGLLGSQNIANTYRSRNTSVYAQLQLDMTGYGSGPIGIITDFTHANLTTFVRLLIDVYTFSTWSDSSCGYGCSDHASWFRAGYPSAFPFEAPFGSHSPYIHTANDLITTLNFNKIVQFARLAVGFAVELAEPGGTL